MPARGGQSSGFDFARHVRADDVVAWPQGTGEPLGLTRRLVAQRHALPGLELFVGMMTSDTVRPEHADRFRFRTLNGAGTTRRLTMANVADIVPAYVSAVPGLVRSGAIRVDVVLLRVRPHPKPGYFTVGVMADFVPAFVAAARCVIAEIDERMPVTAQDALVAADRHRRADGMRCGRGADLRSGAGRDRQAASPRTWPRWCPTAPPFSSASAVCRSLSAVRSAAIAISACTAASSPTWSWISSRGVSSPTRERASTIGRIVTGGLFGSRRLMQFAERQRCAGNALGGLHAQPARARAR